MLFKITIILFWWTTSSCAFWWSGNDREIDQTPALKQVPVGYFRTYTYQPLTINPQTTSPFYQYQIGRMQPPNTIFNWPQKLTPSNGFQASVYGPSLVSQSSAPVPVITTAGSSSTSGTVPMVYNTPTQNSVPMVQIAGSNQSPPAASSTLNSGSNNNPTHMMPSNNQPTVEMNQPQQPPVQQYPPLQNHNIPPRPISSLPDPINMQYLSNVSPVPLQHVQFVPCMCPVTVSMTNIGAEMLANKRSDDMLMSQSDMLDIQQPSQSDKQNLQMIDDH